MNNCCKQTLAQVEKIIDKHYINCFSVGEKHLSQCSCCRIDKRDIEQLKEEIKNLKEVEKK